MNKPVFNIGDIIKNNPCFGDGEVVDILISPTTGLIAYQIGVGDDRNFYDELDCIDGGV